MRFIKLIQISSYPLLFYRNLSLNDTIPSKPLETQMFSYDGPL